jgi:Amino acid permease
VWEFIHILDLLHSLSIEPTWIDTRLVAFGCLTSICLIHGTFLKLGLRLQNTLGVFKLLVLGLIPLTGVLYLAGINGFQVGDEYEKPNNFTWDTFWEGSGTGSSAFVNGLYNVLWYKSWLATCLFSDDFKVFRWVHEH